MTRTVAAFVDETEREGPMRRSPIKLPGTPARTEDRNGWPVVLEYQGQAGGPALVDLSHRPKWDLQAQGLAQAAAGLGLAVPDSPGGSLVSRGRLINRLNRVQLSIWQLLGPAPAWPASADLTETTDGLALVALLGQETEALLAKVSALDLAPPQARPPFVLQGPAVHVPLQVAVPAWGGALLAMARGYGQAVAEVLLDAGGEFNLRPAGEEAFTAWFSAAVGSNV
jgi:hypothetical protein